MPVSEAAFPSLSTAEVKGTRNMALELYMLGLVVQDMDKSLEFYRRLGLDIPVGSEQLTHVEVKMGSGLTFFLDSRPSRFDPRVVRKDHPERMGSSEDYRFLLE